MTLTFPNNLDCKPLIRLTPPHHTHLLPFRLQYRPLLNMQFKVRSHRHLLKTALFVTQIPNPFQLFLHRLSFPRNLLQRMCPLQRDLPRPHPATHHTHRKPRSFLVRPAHHAHRPPRLYILFLQRPQCFQSRHHPQHAIIPPSPRLGIEMTAHHHGRQPLSVFSRPPVGNTIPDSPNIPHLIHLHLTPQRSRFFHKPVPHLFVRIR